MGRQIRVFVSSTSQDLEDHRAAARLVILDVGWAPVMMEHFGARPDPTVEGCKAQLAECDLVVALIAFRRGWVPTREQGGNGVDSITALEIAFAKERGIPILALLAAEDTWPGRLWEAEQQDRDWVKGFRARLNLPAVFFGFEDSGTSPEGKKLPAFRAKLREVLARHLERVAKQVGTAGGVDFFDSAFSSLADGTAVPFLGPGIYEGGDLTSAALASALGATRDEACLATAAEYRERFLDSRDGLLLRLRQLLAQRTNALPRPPRTYELLLDVKPPPLIVSATYDLVLERLLESAQKPYLSVSHVVRSAKGEHDGKVLVMRGAQLELTLADRVDTSGADFVIYKPLGSPFINDRFPDHDLEIDTVVITESDHLTLLGRLENQHTQIPASFSRTLQRRPLLFLGWSLDVWQYRLVAQVFQSIGKRVGRTCVAIRDASSAMEQLAWRRIGADLVPGTSEDFAERVARELSQSPPAAT